MLEYTLNIKDPVIFYVPESLSLWQREQKLRADICAHNYQYRPIAFAHDALRIDVMVKHARCGCVIL